ncbi:AAA family ATPase [Salinibacter altiplanensis]|uniref:bifunctional aminoglycoside phosphotransferase/ATP-binding protein n=1 Tax=Salinibacter altiplanensis TaxID=1803181 RepID=UPI000C9F35B4|nr:bifunctional aminoglycoside phosphotransferase/ATP-binding protein [Salinibacter altiplanensis]
MAPSISALQNALSSPAAYPHTPDRIEFEQTHISLVALAPPQVYKIKKPVSLTYLDFSTLERRRHFCEQEVRLNRRLAPDIYEGVVPIVETDDGLRVDGPPDAGTVVEVAVKMRYLDPDQFFDARLARGAASAADLDRVVQTLCAFYESHPSTPDVAEAGRIDRLRAVTEGNFAEAEAEGHVGHLLSRPAHEALRFYADHFYDQRASLLHRRRAEGFIVEGHGDLRLEHVHLTDDRVAIFDCVEFNDELRHLDVASDVAFLAMDLDRKGHPELSRRFARRMADGLSDPALRTLLPFYKSQRAQIRGKVHGLRATEDEVPPAERARSRAQARRCYQLALRYAVAGPEPLVVVMMGRPGTGKSTQAEAVARALGWPHLASDRVRKTQMGIPLHQRPDAATRERLYADATTEATYATLRTRALERARRHQGTVLDATFSRPAQRAQLRSALRAADVPYVFVEVTAPDNELKQRLRRRSTGDATASDARADDFEMLTERYEAPDALEDPRHVRMGTEGTPAQTTLDILKTLIRLSN